ncbi:MAG: PD40 domain-containing protein [Kiritimatiellae bacterium]|nr:PD40 domain-containing protein [Kiritimatiellia bacterium]
MKLGSLCLLSAMILLVGCVTAEKKADKPIVVKKAAAAPMIQKIAPVGEELIVFSSNRSGPWRIWTIKPDGKDKKQIIKGDKDEEHDVDPNFSPCGTKIVFTSTRGGKNGVWIANIDGTEIKRVCDGRQAEFSSDGKSIAFVKNDKVFIRALADGKEKQIVPDKYKICAGPSWSPDNKTISFACRWNADNALFTVPVAGGAITKVYDKKGACEPHWSPAGDKLVYETETHICTIQPDGLKNRLITYYGGVQRYGRWSRDGKKLVYCQGVTEKGPWELYIVPSGGGGPVKITEEGSDMNPDWR